MTNDLKMATSSVPRSPSPAGHEGETNQCFLFSSSCSSSSPDFHHPAAGGRGGGAPPAHQGSASEAAREREREKRGENKNEKRGRKFCTVSFRLSAGTPVGSWRRSGVQYHSQAAHQMGDPPPHPPPIPPDWTSTSETSRYDLASRRWTDRNANFSF